MAMAGNRPRGRWWSELLLIAVVYAAYSAGRLLAQGSTAQAIDHGTDLLSIEKVLHVNLEHPLNRAFTAHASLGVPADFSYATLHYLVTPAVLIWLWRARREHYRRLRSWLMGSTLIGLVGFILLPTCPPRLLHPAHGFTDTMAQYASYGWWGGEASAPRGLGGMTNQYAAMPSLHVGWALWCGIVLWRHAKSWPLRVLAVAYPVFISVVVMGTANHYLLDAVAGVAVMGLGWLLSRPLMRFSDTVRCRARALVPGLRAHAPEPTTVSAPVKAPVPDGSPPAAGSEPASVPSSAETRAAEAAGAVPDTAVSGEWQTAARGTHIPRPRTGTVSADLADGLRAGSADGGTAAAAR